MLEDSSCLFCRSFLATSGSACVLDGKVCVSVDIVSGVSQGTVLGPLLFILYTSELFHIVGSHMVAYADDLRISSVIPK